MPDPYEFWTADLIAAASACPVANVREHWPRIAAMRRASSLSRWPTQAVGPHRSFAAVPLTSGRPCDRAASQQTSHRWPVVLRGFSWPTLASDLRSSWRCAPGCASSPERNRPRAFALLLTWDGDRALGARPGDAEPPQPISDDDTAGTTIGDCSRRGRRPRRMARCGHVRGAQLVRRIGRSCRSDRQPRRSPGRALGYGASWYALLASRSPLTRNRGASPGRVLDGAGHLVARIIP